MNMCGNMSRYEKNKTRFFIFWIHITKCQVPKDGGDIGWRYTATAFLPPSLKKLLKVSTYSSLSIMPSSKKEDSVFKM